VTGPRSSLFRHVPRGAAKHFVTSTATVVWLLIQLLGFLIFSVMYVATAPIWFPLMVIRDLLEERDDRW
jgi:hypothetical protein